MKVKELYLYGFGQHRDKHFKFAIYQAIIGANESGKSTIYEAILQILFGFPTRANSKRLEPKNGGSFGGWLQMEIENVNYRIERVAGKSSGNATVSVDGNVLGGEEVIATLLKGLTRNQVEAIFAFHLFDLQQLHQLSEEDLTELFFVSGTTGVNPYAGLKKEAEKEMQRLYRPGGRKPLLNQQLETLKKIEFSLEQAAKHEHTYITLSNQELQLQNQLDEIRQKIKINKECISKAEEQQLLIPYFDEYDMLSSRLTQTLPLISEEQEMLALSWEKERRELTSRIENMSEPSKQYVDEMTFKNEIAHLENFLQNETEWREARAKISELEEQLEAIVREQQPLLSALNIPSETVDQKVLNYDVSFQQEQRLHHLLSASNNITALPSYLFYVLALATTVFSIISEQIRYMAISIIFIAIGAWVQLKKTGPARDSDAIARFFQQYDIQVDSDYRAETIFDGLRELQKLEIAYRQKEERLHMIQQQVQDIHRLAKNLQVVESGQGESFREIRERLHTQYAELKTVQLNNEENRYHVQKIKQLKEELHDVTNQLDDLLKELNLKSMDEFYTRLEYSKQSRRDKERLAEVNLRIAGERREQFSKAVLQQERDELEKQLEEKIQLLIEVEQKQRNLISNQERHELLQAYEEQKEQFASLVTDWSAWRALHERIEDLYAHYQQEVFPATLSRASNLFKRFTSGAYTSLNYQEKSFLAVHSDGVHFKPEELSQATKEQAYLALRFALAEEMTKEKPFILLMDDPFVHFDADRFQQVVQWLMSEDNTLPFIYFSCHEEITEFEHSVSIVNLQAERSLL